MYHFLASHGFLKEAKYSSEKGKKKKKGRKRKKNIKNGKEQKAKWKGEVVVDSKHNLKRMHNRVRV